MKDELVKLKNNFKFKLQKRETQVQKVSNEQMNNEINMLGMRYGSDGDVIKKDFREYILELQRQNQELKSKVGSSAINGSMTGSNFQGEEANSTGKIEGAFQWLKGIGDKLVSFTK